MNDHIIFTNKKNARDGHNDIFKLDMHSGDLCRIELPFDLDGFDFRFKGIACNKADMRLFVSALKVNKVMCLNDGGELVSEIIHPLIDRPYAIELAGDCLFFANTMDGRIFKYNSNLELLYTVVPYPFQGIRDLFYKDNYLYVVYLLLGVVKFKVS